MKFLMLELVLRLETSVAASKPVTHKLGVPFFLNKGPAVLLIFLGSSAMKPHLIATLQHHDDY